MSTNLKLFLLISLTIVVIVMVAMLKPIAQDPAYHHFADTRAWLGIPNFMNVVSNFLFIVVGIKGWMLLSRATISQGIFVIYATLFAGIVLTGLGSGYYHLHPDNNSLVYDRLPMTIVFMALLSATIGEFIDPTVGLILLIPLIGLGVGSVLWWHYTEGIGKGDLRLYGFVQFYPIIFIPLVLILFPTTRGNGGTRQLVWVVVWYIVAKLCEQFDRQIYSALGFVSGHSLKHIAAAMATWYLVRMFRGRYTRAVSVSQPTCQ